MNTENEDIPAAGHYVYMTKKQLELQMDFERNFKLMCKSCKSLIPIGDYFSHIAQHMLDRMQNDNASE